MPGFDDDLRLAHVLADAVERTALELSGSVDPEDRPGPDGTVRTRAAVRLEELLRHQLHRTRPRDRVEGRWLPATGRGERRWVLDAIDGSASYVRGLPAWATLISLVVDEDPVLGLVAAPSLARRWWAGRGSGAWTGRTLARARQVHVSTTSVLAHASVSADQLAGWVTGPRAAGFTQVVERSWSTRAYGDFWSHTLLAEGAVDVALAARADAVQLAALLPLLQEAGATVTDPWGQTTDLRLTDPERVVVASNGHLHEEVLAALSGAPVDTADPAPAIPADGAHHGPVHPADAVHTGPIIPGAQG